MLKPLFTKPGQWHCWELSTSSLTNLGLSPVLTKKKPQNDASFLQGKLPLLSCIWFVLSNSLSFPEEAAIACFGTDDLSSRFYSREDWAALSNKFLKIGVQNHFPLKPELDLKACVVHSDLHEKIILNVSKVLKNLAVHSKGLKLHF